MVIFWRRHKRVSAFEPRLERQRFHYVLFHHTHSSSPRFVHTAHQLKKVNVRTQETTPPPPKQRKPHVSLLLQRIFHFPALHILTDASTPFRVSVLFAALF